ncbi:MAG: Rrf2 family transcriptional regulator [Coriobacteriales bacterium]|jgi:Rrf2 family protein|nr:Rrf2 family transcriptional regulator [Coriobacteriales bacterium]
MKVSTKGQHALRVMLDFAGHAQDGYIRLRDVADRQGISKTYLEQIMVLLNKGDLFITARGYQGGYRLKRPAQDYTVGDILRITEGDLSPVEPEEDAETGADRRVSLMAADVWKGLEEVVVAYLDKLTLQDVLDAHKAEDAYEFFI